MEEVEVGMQTSENNTPEFKTAEILCAEDFGSEHYCVVVDGVYFRPKKNTLKLCDKPTFNYFKEKISFPFIPKNVEIDFEKLREAAEQVLKEKKQQYLQKLENSKGKEEVNDASQKKTASVGKVGGLRVGSAFVQSNAEKVEKAEKAEKTEKKQTIEKSNSVIYQLLEKHESPVNNNLKDSRFKLDANSHALIDKKAKFKVEFHSDGSAQSDRYTDFNDPSLPQNLADIHIAVVKTLQTLFKQTDGEYPKEKLNLFLAHEGCSRAEVVKIANDITPKFKEILRKELLKSEFDVIRHLIMIEGEAVAEVNDTPKRVAKSVSFAPGFRG